MADDSMPPPIHVGPLNMRVGRTVLDRLTDAELTARIDRQLPGELAGDGRTATAIALAVRRKLQHAATEVR